MRIVHLANHAQMIGNGTVNMMVDLACAQARMGQDVLVASSGGSFEPLLRRHGITHIPLQQSRQPWRVPSMIAGFNRLIDRFDPDIVHAHMMTGALISRFGSMRRRFALVTTVHHELQKSASLVRAGDRMVAVSRAVAMDLEARGIGPERLAVVLNGAVNAPRLVCRPAAKPVRLRHPNIVCVAGMYRRKGIADLLSAFTLVREQAANERDFLPEPHLYLVGEGPDRGSLEALADRLGIAAVTHFTGFVPDARPYFANADVFALLSHQDPSPLVIAEAREAGCAIVATRVGGIPEMLDDGAAGVLVPAGDIMQAAEKLHWLLLDRPARAQFAARARQNLQPLSVERVSAEYMAIYQQTLAERDSMRLRQATLDARRARTQDGAI
ncbi:glycosyl transferase [Burkholderia sp. SFA1]|uniref:glycosyltransferase n=1 Tax=unclassified Caballeronia TaxID=2646786 RepID=UPI000238834D|nr:MULTISPECIES: glycosyltransferase [unclassified Caballeronia]AET89432.1 putative lipopolysaccharide core biosynthesis glycosyl transferase [Burkholderia sp. YI23]MCE4541518.1 glycosyltransferase [Caballeronia sp. PC1]MCE4569438.1 glycosyltransferase [Caballeronia sp. CLC5]BBP96591.1 glycosyl transferase [Burkholderia sp. SFA1]